MQGVGRILKKNKKKRKKYLHDIGFISIFVASKEILMRKWRNW
ncbi:MAG: hypothetical protein K0S24_4464 [Sphingobacterium sp.]|nr:hypothetical protein [Sphingobacterium sp.]MDF2853399.1 hypothetical protein [Sphingobacterium multivorum]